MTISGPAGVRGPRPQSWVLTWESRVLHHVELWVPDLTRATAAWGWLLQELGWQPYRTWPAGRSWPAGETYLVIEESPALRPGAPHDRLRPGMNHLAFHAPDRATVDAVSTAAPAHGWTLLFPGRHPYAGGPEHYAAYLENADGFEVEVVARERSGSV